ncbi:hypothetical protein EMGBD2_13780 [Nitrospirota bacterium]|nr:hypothetical protein EMGBD2_13780 [Nitrospirota bacterium]GDX89028.1 hypothetical protein LBMAG45_08840 [Nitrospirota bacterium]
MTRFILLTLCVLLMTSDACAKWTQSGENEGGILTHYVDRGTIRRTGHLTKMWALQNFAAAQASANNGKPFRSKKVRFEFDCRDEKHRLLASFWYAGLMGRGDIVDSGTTPGTWAPIIPDSVQETWWGIACKKK